MVSLPQYNDTMERKGLNGLFPPKRGERGFENISNLLEGMPKGYREMIEAQRKEEQDLYSSYGKDYMDPSAHPRSGGRYTQEFMDYAKNKGYGIKDNTFMDAGMSLTKKDWDVQREKFHPSRGGLLQGFTDRGGRRPDFTPRPSGGAQEYPSSFTIDARPGLDARPELVGPAVIQPSPPYTTMPTPQPPKTGGPFGGGGKGGNFLNRFERLLDGLEGLVGKLGGSGSTPESPFPTGDSGGLAEVIKTPFTPTQDY